MAAPAAVGTSTVTSLQSTGSAAGAGGAGSCEITGVGLSDAHAATASSVARITAANRVLAWVIDIPLVVPRAQRRRSAARAVSTSRSASSASSSGPAPSAMAVRTSSAAHLTSNIRSPTESASSAVSTTESGGSEVPASAARAS
ncbi:DUF429 domain-containing protein [Tsukamurella sputi]|uniref:DUF429 domain-containing protein n=1 Tax=Tsukamurella sputi TaxID=2591848 RepID=A0A5C5RNW5_9ACTN|nr:DUF429 domain-containing protein [Tsukamurella sputi]